MVYVSTIISGAASLGVLIGLVCGIFFLVLTALKWVGSVRTSLYEEEFRRQKRFIASNSFLAVTDSSDPLDTKNDLENTLNERLQEKTKQIHTSDSVDAVPFTERQKDFNSKETTDPSPDTIQVRELIEKMVESMIGGPLDGTTVGQLSTHSAYKTAFESEEIKQTNLKRLIKRIVTEAMALPNIKEILCRPKTTKEAETEDFKNKSYEDILATAILNKIIENFQNQNYKENKANERKLKLRSRNKKAIKTDDNDDSKSEGDWSDTSRSDQLSLTVEEYVEEVTTAFEMSEDEKSEFSDFETSSNRRVPFPESGRTVIDAGTDDENSDYEEQNTATELITATNTWEENWLFQKKRLRSTPNAHHPVPVPMLVPNPSQDFKALVGGIDAEDLSDMSDCSESILELITTDEKPSEEKADHQTIEENDIKVELVSKKEEENIIAEMLEKAKEENLSSSNEIEQEINGTTERPSSPIDYLKEEKENSVGYENKSLNGYSSSAGTAFSHSDMENENNVLRCRVAQREKEKWMNPVPLPDNPYSLENLEKREQRKKNEYFRMETYTGESIDFPEDVSSDEISLKKQQKPRFARDYYINASKYPSGMSSPSFESLPQEPEQVSRYSYEAFLTCSRKRLKKPKKSDFYSDNESDKYFTAHQQFRNLFSPMQTMRSRHFSQVFKTSAAHEDARFFNKYHTYNPRQRVKENLYRKSSLERELSDFEQKSLREDLKHSLFQARGASPNFILNPVFKPDSGRDSSKAPFSALPYEVNNEIKKIENSDAESLDPITPTYNRITEDSRAYKKISRTSQESGYGSDSLDYSSDSLEFWRLTPPKTPEVVESSFVSIAESRRRKENLSGGRMALSGFY